MVDLTLERYRDLMKRGAVLVDEADDGEDIRALFNLEHSVQDGRLGRGGNQLVVSQRLQFVEIDHAGTVRDAGPAPYLDCRPIRPEERAAVADRLAADWLTGSLEAAVMAHAVMHMVPGHVEEVRARRLPEIAKIEAEVQARLRREIVHWDNRADDLRAQERAGRPAGRLNAGQAEARAQDLADRLGRRLAELSRERDISALPPVIRGGSLVVPVGLLRALGTPEVPIAAELAEASAELRAAIERAAMEAVIAAERALGFEPIDVSAQNLGYDIEKSWRNIGIALHRGQRSGGRRRDSECHAKRDSLRPQQAGRLHPRARVRFERLRCRTALYPPALPARAGYRRGERDVSDR